MRFGQIYQIYLCMFFTGPDYWGLLNKEWSLCKYGQHQSPVDINPKFLLFDPNLRPVRTDSHRVGPLLKWNVCSRSVVSNIRIP